ncbi:antitoxin VbhA family protein [Variovorax sp. SRS16]|uniref:antitoxin VbhA family protein n=1 Tax=Variovorax sp. SRS16 TaxID=282217 RepID=UPI0013A5A331
MTTESTVSPHRKWAHEQALASARIEGHEPSPDFLKDCDELMAEQIDLEEFQRRVARRAAALEQAANPRNG